MKKRFLAAVLALTMTAACMTACGGENKTEDKQQTTTTTTEETTTTTTTETTTATEKEAGVIDTFTITKVTTTKITDPPPSEVPQDVNPGQWHEDSETTTTTTTTKAATTTTKAKTTTTKATTTKATTTKAKGEERRPSEVPQDVNPGQWHEDPGITKADLKTAAEAAFAKVKKTAKEYGWTLTGNSVYKDHKVFVNRSTDTQYGIFFPLQSNSRQDLYYEFVIKAEVQNGKLRLTANQQGFSTPVGSVNYDDYYYSETIDSLIKFLKSDVSKIEY